MSELAASGRQEIIELSARRILLIISLTILALILGAALAVMTVDVASLASRYGSEKLGRKLTIQAIKINVSREISIELHGVSLANIPGGSQPSMAELAYVRADIALSSLISGDLLIRTLSIDGAEMLLEHGPNDRANWKFQQPPSPAGANPARRTTVPALLNTHFKNIEIDIRTSSGALLRTRVNDATGSAASLDKPVTIFGTGSYNDAPVRILATLPSSAAINGNATTLPATLTLDSGTAELTFVGTATDPIGFDGLEGQLVLNAPTPGELQAVAGMSGQIDKPLTLAGVFSHKGNSWQLKEGTGTFDGNALKLALDIEEGTRRQSDEVTLDASFRNLDLNALVQSKEAAPQPPSEMSLLVDPDPGVLLSAHIAADRLSYRAVEADTFDLKAKFAPGHLTIEQLALGIAGGTARSHIAISNRGAKAIVEFDGSLAKVDAAKLSNLLGWGALPLGGPITSQVSGSMTGATLAEARGENRIFAVVTMSDGTIDKKLVSMASTDVRLLFGGPKGSGNLSCLLAILDLKDGQGTIAPLRLMTSNGVILGGGSYNARQDFIDMTIGTQRSSTSFFALDVPVRITGPVSDISVRPAFGATAGGLTAAPNIRDLSPELQALAASSACLVH